MARRRQPPPDVPSRTERSALALCVLAGVVVLPGGLNAFTLPKLALAAGASALALRAPRRWELPRPVVAALLLAAAGVAVGVVLSEHPLLALLGPEPRYPGLVSLVPYVAVALAGAQLLRRVPDDLPRWVAVAALAVAALSVVEHLGVHPLEGDAARSGSLLGNASDQGAWGVLALGVLVVAAHRQRERLVLAGLAAAGVVVALSASRAALLGVVAAATALVLLRPRAWRWAAAAAAVVPLALLVPGTLARVRGQSHLAAATAHGRRLLWQESLQLWWHRPLGVGPGGFLDAVPAEHTRQWAVAVGPANPPTSPESWPLELLLVGGPLLLLAAVVLAVAAGREVLAGREEPLVLGAGVALSGYAVTALFSAVSPGPALLAALLGGALCCRPAPARSRGAARALPVGLALAAVVLALAAVAEVPLRSGVLAVGRGDLGTADSRFTLVRVLRPWDGSVPVQAGHALAARAQLGDRAAAERGLRRLAAAPSTLGVLVDRATCEEALGHLGPAAELLDRARREDPANPLLALRVGVVAAEQHRYDDAERAFLDAASLAPRSPEPWMDLEQLYRLQGRQQEATRAAETARGLG